MTKFALTTISTILMIPILTMIEKYIFNDWEFIRFLIVLIVIDTILGVWKSYIKKCISSKGWGQVIRKLIAYSSLLILTHVMAEFTISGVKNVLFGWFPQFAYSAIIVRECISIVENIGILNPNLLPARILEKLKEIDSKGKFN